MALYPSCCLPTRTISEKVNLRRVQTEKKGLEQFNLDHQAQVDSTTLHARPGCVVVAVRDFRRMEHLKRVLEKTNLRKHDIVVLTIRSLSTGAAEYDLADEQIFSDYEKELFSHVVELAEKEGKPVELLVVPAVNPFDAMVQSPASARKLAWLLVSARGWTRRSWREASAMRGRDWRSRATPSRSKSSARTGLRSS